MTEKSKVLLHAIRINKKIERRERYMSRQFARCLNGVIPTDYQVWYSDRLNEKVIRRQKFIDAVRYPMYLIKITADISELKKQMLKVIEAISRSPITAQSNDMEITLCQN